MISPISIATRGRISRTAKRVLTIAVIGWLTFATTGGGGGSKRPKRSYTTIPEIGRDARREQILKEDEFLLLEIAKWFINETV